MRHAFSIAVKNNHEPVSIKTLFFRVWDSNIKNKTVVRRLIFNNGNAIHVRRHIYIQTTSCIRKKWQVGIPLIFSAGWVCPISDTMFCELVMKIITSKYRTSEISLDPTVRHVKFGDIWIVEMTSTFKCSQAPCVPSALLLILLALIVWIATLKQVLISTYHLKLMTTVIAQVIETSSISTEIRIPRRRNIYVPFTSNYMLYVMNVWKVHAISTVHTVMIYNSAVILVFQAPQQSFQHDCKCMVYANDLSFNHRTLITNMAGIFDLTNVLPNVYRNPINCSVKDDFEGKEPSYLVIN